MISLLPRRSRRAIEPITTPRLRLVAISSALMNAESHDDWHLAQALHAERAPDWPPPLWDTPVRAHILAQLTSQPETVGWHRYILLQSSVPVLVGCIGAFPCVAGDVELGYSMVVSHQRRGLTTEAAVGLIAWLFQQPAVHSVSAQAYQTSLASLRVMERCGMRFVGEGDEGGTVKYRCWR